MMCVWSCGAVEPSRSGDGGRDGAGDGSAGANVGGFGGGGSGGSAGGSAGGDTGAVDGKPTIKQIADAGLSISQIACHGHAIFGLSTESRDVSVLSATSITPVFRVPGAGSIRLQGYAGGVLASSNGDYGGIWAIASDAPYPVEQVYTGRLVAARGTVVGPMWYNGTTIHVGNNQKIPSLLDISDLHASMDTVAWSDRMGDIRLVSAGAQTVVASFANAYAGTMHIMGRFVLSGTMAGLMVAPLAGGNQTRFGVDVPTVSASDDRVVFCNQARPGEFWVSTVDSSMRRWTLAEGTTCKSVALCDNDAYWLDAEGRVMRASM